MFVFNYIVLLAMVAWSVVSLSFVLFSDFEIEMFLITLGLAVVTVLLFFNLTIMIKYIIRLIKKEKLNKKDTIIFIVTIIVYLLVTMLYYLVVESIASV